MHISKNDLFERVWASPLKKLAAEFGVFDMGLAKCCPTPRNSYSSHGPLDALRARKGLSTPTAAGGAAWRHGNVFGVPWPGVKKGDKSDSVTQSRS